MRSQARTDPCDVCGTVVTKTAHQQAHRKSWTCSKECGKEANRRARIGVRRVEMAVHPCEICGAPVSRYPSQHVEGQAWTCSASCRGTWAARVITERGTRNPGQKPRRGTEIPCGTCGKLVYANKSQRANGQGRYCSHDCAMAARRKPSLVKACEVCGKEMALRPSQAYRRYCSKPCDAIGRTKRPGQRLHNGKPIRYDPAGYVLVWAPERLNKTAGDWIFEHRLVMEDVLGRPLTKGEHVHHCNGQRDDNRPENLEAMSHGAHSAMTTRDRWADIDAKLARLAEYERRFGPLDGETP